MLSLKSFLGRRPQQPGQDEIGPDHDLGEGKIEEEAACEALPHDKTEVAGVDLIVKSVSPPPLFRGSPIPRGSWNYGKPPHAAGVYRIIARRSCAHVYCGVASDLRRRQWEHQHIKQNGKYKYYRRVHLFGWKLPKPGASYEDLRAWERGKITQHGFQNNKIGGGSGRAPKRSNAIETAIAAIRGQH